MGGGKRNFFGIRKKVKEGLGVLNGQERGVSGPPGKRLLIQD